MQAPSAVSGQRSTCHVAPRYLAFWIMSGKTSMSVTPLAMALRSEQLHLGAHNTAELLPRPQWKVLLR